jgi:hypothetical protein
MRRLVHGFVCGQYHRIQLGLYEGLGVRTIGVEADGSIFAPLPVRDNAFGNVAGDDLGRHAALVAIGASAKLLRRR